MKGFSETVTVDLPILCDYMYAPDGTLTVYRIDVVSDSYIPFTSLPERIREHVIAALSRSIRQYEEERKTLPMMDVEVIATIDGQALP